MNNFQVGQIIKPVKNAFCTRAKLDNDARRKVEAIHIHGIDCSVVVSGYADNLSDAPPMNLPVGTKTEIHRSVLHRWEVAND